MTTYFFKKKAKPKQKNMRAWDAHVWTRFLSDESTQLELLPRHRKNPRPEAVAHLLAAVWGKPVEQLSSRTLAVQKAFAEEQEGGAAGVTPAPAQYQQGPTTLRLFKGSSTSVAVVETERSPVWWVLSTLK